MAFTTLIDTEPVVQHFGDPSWVVVDCRFVLNDVGWGEREYESSHIPGAVYAHLDRDLSGPVTGSNGRHPLPAPQQLAATFGRWGIDRSVQVVVYDQDNGAFASRLWWLLRWLDHDAVAVIDGGFARWAAEGRTTTSGREQNKPRMFPGAPRADMVADQREVAGRLGDRAWCIVDARAPERYRGEIEPIDRVAGHIPGAVNHPFKNNVDGRGRFLPPETLRAKLAKTTSDVPPNHVICYCGSGVNACQELLAFERAGLTGARLYPGSWSEWSSDPRRPIERDNK